MPDISDVLDATSLFAGVIGLLFASWISDIEKVTNGAVPIHYADRKNFISAVVSTFFSKALPLVLILLAYLYVNASIVISIVSATTLFNAFADNDRLNIEWSFFMMVYWAMLYFALIASVAMFRLVSAWIAGRKGRKASEPRIHFFG